MECRNESENFLHMLFPFDEGYLKTVVLNIHFSGQVQYQNLTNLSSWGTVNISSEHLLK